LPSTLEVGVKTQPAALLDYPLDLSGDPDQDAPAPTPATPEFTLPSRYLPAFWPLFFLGTIITLHALVILLQVGAVMPFVARPHA
jgi:hypothetical protein